MYINEIRFVYNQEESIMTTDKTYKKMYFHLFNAMTDALRALEENDPARAAQILISAQQWGEEAYLELSDEDA